MSSLWVGPSVISFLFTELGLHPCGSWLPNYLTVQIRSYTQVSRAEDQSDFALSFFFSEATNYLTWTFLYAPVLLSSSSQDKLCLLFCTDGISQLIHKLLSFHIFSLIPQLILSSQTPDFNILRKREYDLVKQGQKIGWTPLKHLLVREIEEKAIAFGNEEAVSDL